MVDTADVFSEPNLNPRGMRGPNYQRRATLAEVVTSLHATGQRHGLMMTRLAAALATKKG